ncbi:hypothetical protein DFH07DRAFT_761053 [Mycena maculata]|uniref:Uncharacterized protein n=1 Tax=Mycena maculata TaxID=230809 RepID=A0AAD7HG16_9AGAR|nr:hypothetical protein DFH07DRAFT_761053 [Mycena maculata]
MTAAAKTLRNFKVNAGDPTWKVLPAVLKKYRITDDQWENYAMFICYDSTENRIERCLSYDEQPLLLFQKLTNAKKNPVFMLKHAKEIRSPIVVAQEKHDGQKTPQVSTSLAISTSAVMPGPPGANSSGGLKRVGTGPSQVLPNTSPEIPPVSSSGTSYAFAIYPYMAEQEDELDVVVGDTFVILSRTPNWWVVQRDPTGEGIVGKGMEQQGRAPAGCLLETNVPVASAGPILPLNLISTSFRGIALMDYQKKGEEELDLVRDDVLHVFKRFNHWAYVVKGDGGRGWVPSWFIGKGAGSMDDLPEAQVSSVFPVFALGGDRLAGPSTPS